MKNWIFLKEALRSFKSTGAVASSSPALVSRLVETIPPKQNFRVIELGPGAGCVTQALLDRLGSQASLTAFEINPVFIEKIQQINDPRLRVLPLGAEEMGQFFAPNSVDFIVSSLPLSMIPKEVKAAILTQAQQVLLPQGQFIQYQYALQDYRLLRHYFDQIRVGFTLANLPPAFVYTCSLGLGY